MGRPLSGRFSRGTSSIKSRGAAWVAAAFTVERHNGDERFVLWRPPHSLLKVFTFDGPVVAAHVGSTW